jgi:hypothetical protein
MGDHTLGVGVDMGWCKLTTTPLKIKKGTGILTRIAKPRRNIHVPHLVLYHDKL